MAGKHQVGSTHQPRGTYERNGCTSNRQCYYRSIHYGCDRNGDQCDLDCEPKASCNAAKTLMVAERSGSGPTALRTQKTRAAMVNVVTGAIDAAAQDQYGRQRGVMDKHVLSIVVVALELAVLVARVVTRVLGARKHGTTTAVLGRT